MHNRVYQNQFDVYWAPQTHNLADYFIKHHSITHHQCIHATYLHEPTMMAASSDPHDAHCKGVLNAVAPISGSYHSLLSSAHRLAHMTVTH